MTEIEIRQKVLAILEKRGPLPSQDPKVLEAYAFFEVGHVDSFGLMGFILDLEEAFGIELSPEDTQSYDFRTVGRLARLIHQRLGG